MDTKIAYIENLCKKLGNDYTIQVVDEKHTIWRSFYNGYDIEIAEFSDSPTDNFSCAILLYQLDSKVPEHDGEIVKLVGGIEGIQSIDDLKKHLAALEEKYIR